MPILYYLKEPPLTLAGQGHLDERRIKEISKTMPCISTKAADGRTMLIVIHRESNVSYIKEISDEQYQKMRDKKDEDMKGKRITPAMAVPGRNRGGGN